MKAKIILLLLIITALLIGGCESEEIPPKPSKPVIKPSISDLPPAPPPPTIPTSIPVAKSTIKSAIAQEATDGRAVHILDHKGNGDIVATLPIYRSGEMRYFAAGVGRLERTATYPKFPLKLSFRGSDGALSFVAVTVWTQDESQVWQIPTSHVKGPWVFLDLKEGTYRIDVVKGADRQSCTNLKITTGKQKTIVFTWP